MLNARQSPIRDVDIEAALTQPLHLHATLDACEAFAGADCVIVAAPTDFDTVICQFNTRAVESVIAQAIQYSPLSTIIVRSTVPAGFTRGMREKHGVDTILFMPEFLREGRALHDNLHPSRIVVGDTSARGRAIADLFVAATHAQQVPVLLTGSTEAEAIKLFANSYLAMRVAFFNELDTYAVTHDLDAKHMIEGVCLDSRIGAHYNNPSFGYGGYCLPKDTKQLLDHFEGVPQHLFTAIVDSNTARMDFIAKDIVRRKPKVVGIYRLVMKMGADNFRESSMLGIVLRLKEAGIRMIIYEPLLTHALDTLGEMAEDFEQFMQRRILSLLTVLRQN